MTRRDVLHVHEMRRPHRPEAQPDPVRARERAAARRRAHPVAEAARMLVQVGTPAPDPARVPEEAAAQAVRAPEEAAAPAAAAREEVAARAVLTLEEVAA